MKTIALSQGKTAMVDDGDYDLVRDYGWYASKKSDVYYAVAHIPGSGKPGRKIMMHQLIAGFLETDHINGNGLDNRRSNLRSATGAQNRRNQKLRRDNTSGFKGVSHTKDGKWKAYIYLDSEQYHLGEFEMPEEAATAYGLCALAAFGEFARLQ